MKVFFNNHISYIDLHWIINFFNLINIVSINLQVSITNPQFSLDHDIAGVAIR